MTRHAAAALAICASLARASEARPAGRPRPARRAREIVFPEDAGIVNVRRDFGAKGDGRSDDTEAIRKAVVAGIERSCRYAAPAFVYIPKGTYLVTGEIESRVAKDGWSSGWRSGMILVGEHRDKTVIRLADSCPGYGDPGSPKYVIATGSEADGPNPKGGGNRAFRHSVINMTVDVGRGNPGAVALDYVAHNRGTVEDVVIRAAEGSGHTGLALDRWWPGPCLVKRVEISGFDLGISARDHYQYSVTFEHVRLSGQRSCAVRVKNNVLTFRDLASENSVPVIDVQGGHGFVTVVDGGFSGGSPGAAAVANRGTLFLRDVECSGYGTVVRNESGHRRGVAAERGTTTVAEYASADPVSLFGGEGRSLRLPVKETPEFDSTRLSEWESPVAHGATPSRGGWEKTPLNEDDDSGAIQAAIDSGKEVVYLPNGFYGVKKTIVVRGRVRKITGMQSSIGALGMVDPLIRFEGAAREGTILEHLTIGGTVEHASSRTLAMRHCDFAGSLGGDKVACYRNTPEGTGDMFFEDTIGKPILIKHPQNVWARQVNCEFGEKPLIENHGGALWVLGFKTEGEMTCILTERGSTELLGAMLYPLKGPAGGTPAFVNDRGRVSLTYCWNGNNYPLHVKERRGEEWRELRAGDVKGRGPALYAGGNR